MLIAAPPSSSPTASFALQAASFITAPLHSNLRKLRPFIPFRLHSLQQLSGHGCLFFVLACGSQRAAGCHIICKCPHKVNPHKKQIMRHPLCRNLHRSQRTHSATLLSVLLLLPPYAPLAGGSPLRSVANHYVHCTLTPRWLKAVSLCFVFLHPAVVLVNTFNYVLKTMTYMIIFPNFTIQIHQYKIQ